MIRNICLLLLALVLVSGNLFAQRYVTRNGVVRITYHHPLVGTLETENRQVNVGFDAATGELQMRILMLSFRFHRGFHQEMYNDYFVENPHFSNAGFVGQVTNLDAIDLGRQGPQDLKVSGKLTLRNFTNTESSTARFTVTPNGLEGKAVFQINIKDYMHMSHPAARNWPDDVRIEMDVRMQRL